MGSRTLGAGALVQLRADFPDWGVWRDTVSGHLRAEQWVHKSRLMAATADVLRVPIGLQRDVRQDEVAR